MRRFSVWVLFAVFLLSSGCGEGPEQVGGGEGITRHPSPVPGGTMIVAIGSDPDSWNPYTTRNAATANILELLYPRLVHETGLGAQARFDPWLAERWEFSADRLMLTFFLRPNATWSSGEPVTCADLQFTLEMQRSDDLGWQGRSYKDRIHSLECLDDHTAQFRFTEPYADQMLDVNDNAIVPRTYADVDPSSWRATSWEDRLVSAGPYKLVTVTPGQEVVLERDPAFWAKDETMADRLIFRIYPDATAAVQGFLEGEVDVLQRVPVLQAGEVMNRRDLALIPAPSLKYSFIAWNMLEPDAYMQDRVVRGCVENSECSETDEDILRLQAEYPHEVLSDPAVRRALSFGIDRDDLIEGVMGGYADSRLFDLEETRRILEGAGWHDEDGDGVRERNGRRLSLRVITYARHTPRKEALERVVRSLAPAGVEIIAEPLERGEFIRRTWDKNFDGVVSGWRAGSRVEPQMLFHTRAAVDRGNNLGAWSTPESDRLLDQAGNAESRHKAGPLWKRWQNLFHHEAPYAILYEEEMLEGINTRIHGATPTPLNPLHHMHRWWIAPERRESP